MTYHEAGQKGLIREYKKDVKEQYGYRVQYADGYESWSPAEPFEASYKVAETHIERMKLELAELSDKISKATKAMFNVDLLDKSQRAALRRQLKPMLEYAGVLLWRIEMVTEEDKQ
ncbi:MAG: hypothetical protein NC344_05745 [Bacteroidales bacterium]|nr:hypothetical protein [Bacteroidales bacterium]MCM1147323.1 hypothetical protein [Bacteroidales bacterium]MCM1206243.1 hypothetical protein [Bacillota bacterium]